MSDTFTRFMDMHSGGGAKGPADKIIIEAPENEARIIFYNRFGLNPDRVSCTCCGEDYSVSEYDSLAAATSYDRNCHSAYFYADDDTMVPNDTPARYGGGLVTEWDREKRQRTYGGRVVESRTLEQGDSSGYSKYLTLDEYLAGDDVLVVRAGEIADDERIGSVPESGYVWVDQ